MLTTINHSLRPIIESSGGIHLTAYLEHSRDWRDFRLQLEEAIESAREVMLPTMAAAETDRFLAPLIKLRSEERTLRSFRHNVAVFRSEGYSRILSIPVEVEQLCVVANSFHVKPLLRWTQDAANFIWADIRQGICRLHSGDDESVTIVDVLRLIENQPMHSHRQGANQIAQNIRSLRERLYVIHHPKVFLTGDAPSCLLVATLLRQNGVKPTYLRRVDHTEPMDIVVSKIRMQMRRRIARRFANAIREFQIANALNNAATSLWQIARLATRGKVRKLVIAEDFQIFGKLDPSTGKLSVTPTQFDHEDDDVLDDIAQRVLTQGGEVLVTKQKWIPGGRPAMAIIHQQEPVATIVPSAPSSQRSVVWA
jgi:hypothetical protein